MNTDRKREWLRGNQKAQPVANPFRQVCQVRDPGNDLVPKNSGDTEFCFHREKCPCRFVEKSIGFTF